MAELKQEIISRPKRKRIPNRTIFNEDNLTECSGNLDDEGCQVPSVKSLISNSGEDNSSSGCVDIAELKRETISRPKRKRISNRTIFNEDNLTECPGNLQDKGCQVSSVKKLISNSGEDNSSSPPDSSRNDKEVNATCSKINAWLPKCKDNLTNSLQTNPLVNQREDKSYSPPPFTSIPDADLLPVSYDLINSFDQIENVISNNRVVKEDYEEIPHPCVDHEKSSLDKSLSENNVAVGASNNVAYSNRNATSFDSSHPKNLQIANSNSGNATNLNCADFQGLHTSNQKFHFEKSPSENNVVTGGSSNAANSNRATTSTKNLQITNSNSGNATNLNLIDSTSNFKPSFDKNPQCSKYFGGSLNNNDGNSKRSATTTEQMSISEPVPSNAPQYDLQLMSKPVLIDKEKMDALGIRLLSSNVTSCQVIPAMPVYAQTLSNTSIASGNTSNATSGYGNTNLAFNLDGNKCGSTGSSLEGSSCVGLQVVSNNEETIFVEPETIFAVLNMSNKVLDNGTTFFSANQKSSLNLDKVEPVNMGMFDFCNKVKYKVVHTNNKNIITLPENKQNEKKKVTLDKRFESFKLQCSNTGYVNSENSRTKRSLCGSSLEKQVNLAFPKGQGYRLDLSTRPPVSSASGKTWWPSCPPKGDKSSRSSPTNSCEKIPCTAPGPSGDKNAIVGNDIDSLSSTRQPENAASTSGKTWWPSCPPREDKSSNSPTNSSQKIPGTALGSTGNKNAIAGNDIDSLSSTRQPENEASTSGKTWWPSCPPKEDKSLSSPTNSSPTIPGTAPGPSGNKIATAGNDIDSLSSTRQPENSASTPGTPGISIEDKHSKLPPDGSQMIPDATRCPSRSKNYIAGVASSSTGQPEKSASVLTWRPALSPNRDSCSNMLARNSENVQDTILAPLSTNLNNSSGTNTVTKGAGEHPLSECEKLFRNQKFTSCTKSVFRSDGITDAKPTLQKESTKPMAAEAPQKPTSKKVPPLRLHRRYCKDCQLDLETFVAFENHMRTVHGALEVRAYECEICSKTFTRSDHLRTHQVVHTNKKPFGCNICGRRFRSHTSRNYHLMVHADSRPFQCTVEGCGGKFRAKNALLKHLLGKHGIIQS